MSRIDTSKVANNGINGTTKQVIEQLADRTASLPEDGSGGAVITGTVTYTVAADGDPAGVNDFDNLIDALTYVEQTIFVGSVSLTLNDGNHILNSPSKEYYIIRNVDLTIESASSDNTLCSITGDSVYRYVPLRFNNCSVYLNHFTATAGASGDPFIKFELCRGSLYSLILNDWYSGIHGNSQSHIEIITCSISNSGDGSCITMYHGAVGMIRGTNTLSSGTGICLQAKGGSVIRQPSGTLVLNGDTGIWDPEDSRITYIAANMTNNCSTPTGVPINEIQYEGGYISDRTVALTFKA